MENKQKTQLLSFVNLTREMRFFFNCETTRTSFKESDLEPNLIEELLV
jgi:hypothetical protein